MENQNAIKRSELQQCILQVREGDQAAFGRLLVDYTPLVEKQVAQYGKELGDQDREDLRQEALYALYRSALSYDFDQSGVEFGLYAKVCITNALVSHLRVLSRRRFELSFETVLPLNEPVEDPAARLAEEEYVSALYRRARRVLSDYEGRVWSLVMLGYSASQIAARLNKPPHSIENAVYRIRQKLRRELGEGEARK